MSSRGSARRASPSWQPYSIRSRRTGSRTAASGSPGRASARSSTFSSPTISGSVLPRSLSPSSISSRRSSTGSPMISEKTHIGISDATSLDPVELLLRERLLEDPAGEPSDPLLVGVDDPRREPLVDERAQARVGGRVGVDHRLAHLDLLGGEVLQRRAAQLGRVRLPVLRHRDDVVVAREDPEAAAVALLLPVERRLAAQQREPVVAAPPAPRRRGR